MSTNEATWVLRRREERKVNIIIDTWTRESKNNEQKDKWKREKYENKKEKRNEKTRKRKETKKIKMGRK